VLGKHSGRHALGLRCEELGFRLERRELDQVYRLFIVVADRVKIVEDHHLLRLLREAGVARWPSDGGAAPESPAVASAAQVSSHAELKHCSNAPHGHTRGQSEKAPPVITGHEAEQQEDYLRGV